MIPFEPSIEAAVLPLRPKVILVGDASQGDIAATLLAMFDRNDRETNSKKYISMHLLILNSILNLHCIHKKVISVYFPFETKFPYNVFAQNIINVINFIELKLKHQYF